MSEFQVTILVQIITTVFMGFLVIMVLWKQGPKEADNTFVQWLQQMQNDPERMRQVEKMYTHAGTMMQGTLNVMAEVIKVLAPMTALKGDDELVKWLDDIRTPGPPVDDEPTINLHIDTGDEVVKG